MFFERFKGNNFSIESVFDFLVSFNFFLLNLFQDNIENNVYHSNDIDRLQKDNEWIKAFYRHSMEEVDTTICLVDEVFTWRKNSDINSNLNE
jgi:hypothetical protein